MSFFLKLLMIKAGTMMAFSRRIAPEYLREWPDFEGYHKTLEAEIEALSDCHQSQSWFPASTVLPAVGRHFSSMAATTLLLTFLIQ